MRLFSLMSQSSEKENVTSDFGHKVEVHVSEY